MSGMAQKKKGLVAEYSFNEGTASDEVGKNHAKTVGVFFDDDRFGNSKSSCYLQGTDGSYLNLGTSSVLKPVVGSISLWFKIEIPIESGQGYEINPFILTKCHAASNFYEAYSLYYHWPTGRVHGCISKDSLQQIPLHSTMRVRPGEWHHLVLAYDNDYQWLYVDGRLDVKLKKGFASTFLQGDSVMVGHTANLKNKRFFNGNIDDIEIYNKVLSEAEVEGLFEAPDPNRNHTIVKWAFIIALAVLGIVLVTWLIDKRYKKIMDEEKEKNRIRNQMLELEIKAIKAQMNPHFIFNSLNSIQQFILANDNDNAYRYLAKFSKLRRKLLETNTGETISLADEIELLNRYLEIESLRFENLFEYNIEEDKSKPNVNVKIPHMLIQPFVENAIWHGLLHKKDNRKLLVKFYYAGEGRLLCEVEDNGVGRNFAERGRELTTKKSLAIDFIKQRLSLLSKINKMECGVEIIDKKDEQGKPCGTIVKVTIPILN